MAAAETSQGSQDTSSAILPVMQKRRGRYSRLAGLGFIGLSVVFLILSVADQFIVFELDSIIAFIAAIVLLFRDPQAKVPASVFDATLVSSDQTIRELSALGGAGFSYVPTGALVSDVVLVPSLADAPGLPKGEPQRPPSSTLTPPGLGLAVLYTRETGLTELTMDAIRASLPDVVRDSFGIARSVDMKEDGGRLRTTLHHTSASCTCADYPANPGGCIGCMVASFLAVIVTAATKRSLLLERCVHDPDADAWVITMNLGPIVPVSA